MGTRTIPFAVFATDGTLYTEATPPDVTVQYGAGSASAATVTQRGSGWSVDVDDTQDALLLISGTGIQDDALTVLKYPPQLDVNVSSRATAEDLADLALEATAQSILGAVTTRPGAIAFPYELGEDRDGDGAPDRNEDGSLTYPIVGVRCFLRAVNSISADVVDSRVTDGAGIAHFEAVLTDFPVAEDGHRYAYIWRTSNGRFIFPDNPDVEMLPE